jgi:hypothetical protein
MHRIATVNGQGGNHGLLVWRPVVPESPRPDTFFSAFIGLSDVRWEELWTTVPFTFSWTPFVCCRHLSTVLGTCCCEPRVHQYTLIEALQSHESFSFITMPYCSTSYLQAGWPSESSPTGHHFTVNLPVKVYDSDFNAGRLVRQGSGFTYLSLTCRLTWIHKQHCFLVRCCFSYLT